MENESSLLKKILGIASVIGLIGLLGYLFWVIMSELYYAVTGLVLLSNLLMLG